MRIFNYVEITEENCKLGDEYWAVLKTEKSNAFNGLVTDYSTTISGLVVNADTDTNTSNNSTLSNVDITVKNIDNSQIVVSTKNKSDGKYSFNGINSKNNILQFSKTGYYSEDLYLTNVNVGSKVYADTIELIPTTYTGTGSAIGTIKDAVTTNGVGSLTLNIRKGLNNKFSSAIISTTTTDALGNYTISATSGNYTVEVIDNRTSGGDRYLTQYFNIKILGGKTVTGQNAVVSKTLNSNQIRIVLTWGETPRDLDSHLYGPTSANSEFHIFYGSKSYSENGKTIAFLDVDDTSSYGAETTTIYNAVNGVYTFSVYNFTGTPSITTSSAKVQVYIGNANIPSYTFTVPNSGNGRWWNVFKYQSATKTIIPVNSIS